ncbi:cyclase family protein [Corynebacterium comes]|uniref:Cyclase n=1 Tax=Corynebacterium comes TaxID=2675218 RepID=A0A6B8VUR0_9CORY|nr:cyclase family protein [Corynebacterium comes]QGU03397.1 Putative cyclase [Corynebacterium comes]
MPPTTTRPGKLPTYAELKQRPGPVSGTAWGVFGDDDELGTLNLLTEERVRQAASSIREGRRFSLNLALNAFDPPLIAHRANPEHKIFGLNEFHRDDSLDNLYLQASTQVDGLRHFGHPDRGFYGGRPGSEITAETPTLGIQHVAQTGIVGRGVLLDVAAYREHHGKPIDHDAGEALSVQDLERAAEWQNAVFHDGDILLLRTGWLTHVRSRGKEAEEQVRSGGLAATEEMAAWLWDHHFSVVAADNIALEAWPVGETDIETEAEKSGLLEASSHTGMLHRILIPLLGLTIGELWDLDELADACRELRRHDVFITAEPLNLTGGVGSPANVLAIL